MSCVNKRNNEFNIEEQLKKLTCPDDAVEKLAEEVPVLDDDAKERILRLCEKKMNINTTNKKQIEITKNDYDASNVVKGVDRYKKPKWYRTAMSTAASLILVAGIGGGAYFITKNKPALQPTDSVSSNTIISTDEKTENELEELFKKNIYLYDNVFMHPLPYKDGMVFAGDESVLYEVEENELFSDYNSFREYVNSVYADKIATYYLDYYYNGQQKYIEHNNMFCVDVSKFPDGNHLIFKYKNYDINILDISDKDGTTTCRFNVIVDGEIYNTFDEITEETIDDFVIGAEAVKVDDGWRLTDTYGSDTIDRLRFSNYIDGYIGFIDKTWQEVYLEDIQSRDIRYAEYILADYENDDIPEMYIKYGDSSLLLTCISGNAEPLPMSSAFEFSEEMGIYTAYSAEQGELIIELYDFVYCDFVPVKKLYKNSYTNEYKIDDVYCTEAEYNEALYSSNDFKEIDFKNYSYNDVNDYLSLSENVYTETQLKERMTSLFNNNNVCYDFIRYDNNNGSLNISETPVYVDEANELYEISDDIFCFSTIEDYERCIRSIYTKEIADEILTEYPNLIKEYEGKMCYNKKAVDVEHVYYVDWSDFWVEIDSFTDTTCTFTAKTVIQATGADYWRTCEAVKEGDYGWRLKKIYF